MSIYDKAGVALIPSGTKASKLYSVLPANGNGDFTHSRGSTATRVNKDGLIESVAANVPRLDYPLIDGVVQDCPALLLEPQRTNGLPYSLEYDNNTYYTKTNSTITTQSGVSPDGSNTAYKLQDTNDSGNTSHYVQQASGYRATITYNAIKSGSIFVKAGTKNQVQVRLVNGSGSFSYIMGNFDLETETILTGASANASNISYELQNHGNGWYRCIVKGSWTLSNVSQTAMQVFIADSSLAALPNMHNYQGDGTGNLFVWGQMIEQGSYQTSYIPTSGSAVTRSADVCNGSGTSAEFNDSEGVLFAEIAALADDLTFRHISISDGTNSNIVQLRYRSTSNVLQALLFSGGVGEVYGVTLSDITTSSKAALKYKENDVAFWVDGFERVVDSLASTFPEGTLDTLRFERGDGGGSNDFYGKTKQLMTFKTALNDSELETLTSWDSFNAMATGQLYTIE